MFLSAGNASGDGTPCNRPRPRMIHRCRILAGCRTPKSSCAIWRRPAASRQLYCVLRWCTARRPHDFFARMRWLQRGVLLPLPPIDNGRSLISNASLLDLITVCLSHLVAPGRISFAADDAVLSTRELLRWLAVALAGRYGCCRAGLTTDCDRNRTGTVRRGAAAVQPIHFRSISQSAPPGSTPIRSIIGSHGPHDGI